MLNIASAEDAFLTGVTAWESFITEFEARWYAPLTMTMLAGALMSSDPATLEYLRATDPVGFDALMGKIRGGSNGNQV